ncbi:hypothetical protein SDC9_99244 [bioreactor metagenome]|uniref:Uncharacterized protein n=1 Tax=bioreactor metagenome TaxID=1076179 RepID=A0A645AH17_9ZZZZ
MIGRVKLAGDETRHEATERCANLVAARREPFAGEDDDARLDAGECGRNLDEVHIAKLAALLLRFITPADTEEVQGIDVPKTHVGQLVLNLVGDQVGIAHLRNLRDDNALLTRSVDAVLKAFAVFRQVDHVFHS